jgi:small subunit ribosomal protein S8
MTDPIADLLTRIRNGLMAKHTKVDIPSSRMKVSIAKILKDEGFIKNYKVIRDNKQGILRIYLKFDEASQPVLEGIRRISRPGRRIYVSHEKIPKVMNGLGLSILSTSRGLMTDREARQHNLGGEVLCSAW